MVRAGLRMLVAAVHIVLAASVTAQDISPNLVPNGSFEQEGLAGWHLTVEAGGPGRAAVVKEDPYRGHAALLLDATESPHEVGAWSDPIAVEPGGTYRLQAYVKQTAGYGYYKVVIDWRDGQQRHLSYANDWKGSNWPQEYAPHGGDFVAPPQARQAVLLLGVSAGSACLMDELSLTPLPPRGARLRGYLFCEPPDERGVRIVRAWLRNEGDRASSPGRARLVCPEGLVAADADRPLAALVPSERVRLQWQVQGMPQDASAPLRVEITGDGWSLEATTLPTLTTSEIVAHEGTDLPPSRPVAGDTLVGAYYFPVMLDWEHWGWGLRHVDTLTPILGYYDEALPEVAEWHIRWATEHGIGFFAYDWYYNDGSLFIHDALEKGFLRARNRSQMKFCINWCNEGQCTWDRPLNYSTESLCGFMTYLCQHYLNQPEYLTVGGRPVVMIIRPDPIMEWHGGPEGNRQALEAMRQVARDHGHPDVYFMCIGLADRAAVYRRAGYDAITAYSYGWGNAPRYENGDCDFDDLVAEHEQAWQTAAASARAANMGYMPVVWTGWDDLPRARERAIRTRDNTPGPFREMCTIASRYVDPAVNLLIIEAWNEWGEGSVLEPSRQRGFGLLDAVRDALTPARGPHQDVIPSPATVAGYETHLTLADIEAEYIRRDRARRGISPLTRMDWAFDTEGDLQGWHRSWGLSRLRVEDGCLRGVSLHADPAIVGPALMDVEAAGVEALEIRMSVDRGGWAQVFWNTEGGNRFTEEASARWELIPDGQMHTYRVPVGSNPLWRGTIRQLRLDPVDAAGVNIAVDAIRGIP